MEHFLLILVNKIRLILRGTQIAIGISNIKCTLVQALRLCTGRTAHRESRGMVLLFHDRGTRRGWGISVTIRPLFTPRKHPVRIVQEAEWAPGPVWTDAGNLAPPGFDPQTVQPVASRYTDYATRPTSSIKTSKHSLRQTNLKPIPTFPLAFQSRVLTICTNFVKFQNQCSQLTQCVVLFIILRINRGYFPKKRLMRLWRIELSVRKELYLQDHLRRASFLPFPAFCHRPLIYDLEK